MQAPRRKVSSIAEFAEWVEEVAERFTDADGYEVPWFRGVGEFTFKLIPGLYRTEQGKEKLADDELRSEFRRKALPLVADRAPRDDWEWYFLMQHYRAPTRLLDWTDSALVALYFALTSSPPQSGRAQGQARTKPAVWALNPFALNRHAGFGGPVGTDWFENTAYLPPPYSGRRLARPPVAIDPTFTAQRMLVQHSHFTLHGHDCRGLDEMRAELSIERDLLRVIIDVDQDELEYLLWHLRLLGITETTIFPDLEGLARELRLEYGLDKTRPKSS
ncbi:MAG: FRG domain-containing protein [Bryobacteraceae bacterium]